MRWIWIDKFVEFRSGEFARAVKNLTLAEEHLHDHYPGYPVMPASLIIEGLAQTGGILVGEADLDHPGFFRPMASPPTGADPPYTLGVGSVCVETCDATMPFSGTCMPCERCSSLVGPTGLVTLSDVLGAAAPFGEATGWCRQSCLFDPDTRGVGCRPGYTCDPTEHVCVEGCTSDLECQARIVPTWDGERVSGGSASRVRSPGSPGTVISGIA